MLKIPKPTFIFLLLALGIIIHQYIVWGKIFEFRDIHHETFILTFLGIAIGIWYYTKRKIRYVKVG